MHDDVNSFTRGSGERLAELETGMSDLRGNGQPGRMSQLETAVRELDRWQSWVIGITAGVSGIVSVIVSGASSSETL